ncbi:hypothetical protein NZK27_09775 [Synechococcus sp. FGCU-3]|nr:hypothetical protein [Synechococcus sp. FGCU3]
MVEDLFYTLKHELGIDDDDEEIHPSPKDLQRELTFRIDDYYNSGRRSSTLNNACPIGYQQQYIRAPTLALADF